MLVGWITKSLFPLYLSISNAKQEPHPVMIMELNACTNSFKHLLNSRSLSAAAVGLTSSLSQTCLTLLFEPPPWRSGLVFLIRENTRTCFKVRWSRQLLFMDQTKFPTFLVVLKRCPRMELFSDCKFLGHLAIPCISRSWVSSPAARCKSSLTSNMDIKLGNG